MTVRLRQKLIGLIVVVAAAVGAAAVAARQDDPPQPNADAAAGASADEKAVREFVARFAAAYNQKDADAVAALFTPDARVYSEDGRRAEGRPAIRERFATAFEAAPELKIRLDPTSIRFLSGDVAIEDGAAVATEPEDLNATTHYTAVHVRRDGQWLTAEVRDRPASVAEDDQRDDGDHALADLGWLTGEWVDEDDEGLAHTSGRWSEGNSYILRDFDVRLAGLPPSHGTQRIGWDPVRQTIRSWAFDSEGGYTESTWTHVEPDRWIIKSNGFLRDGRATSSTNTLTRVSPDAFRWASADRVLGDEELSAVEEVLVVRRPPAPSVGKK